MPTRIVVDEKVPDARRPAIVDTLRGALSTRADADSLIAVVTKLTSGQLQVFVNHIDDPAVISMLEKELARLPK